MAFWNRAKPEPEVPVEATGPFAMTIEDVFSITGRGTVVTGRVSTGVVGKDDVAPGDEVSG